MLANYKKFPLVSIVVPVYNSELYLRQCLSSITNQTYENLEIICIDDGSTDNSLSIIKECQKSDLRISIITQQNCGVSAARNHGLKQAKGEFLWFVDSDDFLDLDAVENVLYLFNNEKIDFISFGYRIIDEQSNRIIGKNLIYDNKRLFTSKSDWIIYLNLTVWSKVFRTSFLKKHDLFFPENILNEDISHHWLSIPYTNTLLIANKILYNYRIRENSITSKYRQKQRGLAFNLLKNLIIIHDAWEKNGFLTPNYNLFQYLIETYIKIAYLNINDLDKKLFVDQANSYLELWHLFPRKYTLAHDFLSNNKVTQRKYRLINSIRKRLNKLKQLINPDNIFLPSA